MAAVTVRPAGATTAMPVIYGSITMPRTGAWVANLHLSSQVKPSGRVELQAGPILLLGTVNRAGLEAGGVRVRIVGGADGLRKNAVPKHYTSPIVRLPLADLLRDAGEALSAAVDATVLNRTLLAWTTLGVQTGAMVQTLMEVAALQPGFESDDITWRLLPDGTLWAGRETWPLSTSTEFRIVEQAPEDDVWTLAVELPAILPGTTLPLEPSRRVDTVEHQVTPELVRSKVWLAP
jgi:hypothetical protein